MNSIDLSAVVQGCNIWRLRVLPIFHLEANVGKPQIRIKREAQISSLALV